MLHLKDIRVNQNRRAFISRATAALVGFPLVVKSHTLLPVWQVGEYWLATTLAEGALAWAGGEFMKTFFGSSNPRKDKDLAAIIEAAVLRLAGIIRQEIKSNALDQAIAAVDATRTSFLDDLNAPSRLRLEATYTSATNAVAQLRTLAVAGHPSYMGAVTLRILILQERSRRFAGTRNGELRNIVAQIDTAIEHHKEMTKGWEKWNFNRYTKSGLRALKDERVIKGFGNMPQEFARREKFITEDSARTYNQEVYPKYIAPGDEVVRRWMAIKNAIAYCIARDTTNLNYIAEVTRRFETGKLGTGAPYTTLAAPSITGDLKFRFKKSGVPPIDIRYDKFANISVSYDARTGTWSIRGKAYNYGGQAYPLENNFDVQYNESSGFLQIQLSEAIQLSKAKWPLQASKKINVTTPNKASFKIDFIANIEASYDAGRHHNFMKGSWLLVTR